MATTHRSVISSHSSAVLASLFLTLSGNSQINVRCRPNPTDKLTGLTLRITRFTPFLVSGWSDSKTSPNIQRCSPNSSRAGTRKRTSRKSLASTSCASCVTRRRLRNRCRSMVGTIALRRPLSKFNTQTECRVQNGQATQRGVLAITDADQSENLAQQQWRVSAPSKFSLLAK
ncbi:MAG: hypothetical protein JWO95_2622 [Verrucomicrobiales bacterium]|nr:hypothetical protein [Verrucomicrobiales bacterium]